VLIDSTTDLRIDDLLAFKVLAIAVSEVKPITMPLGAANAEFVPAFTARSSVDISALPLACIEFLEFAAVSSLRKTVIFGRSNVVRLAMALIWPAGRLLG